MLRDLKISNNEKTNKLNVHVSGGPNINQNNDQYTNETAFDQDQDDNQEEILDFRAENRGRFQAFSPKLAPQSQLLNFDENPAELQNRNTIKNQRDELVLKYKKSTADQIEKLNRVFEIADKRDRDSQGSPKTS